jgi:hypothetical protein
MILGWALVVVLFLGEATKFHSLVHRFQIIKEKSMCGKFGWPPFSVIGEIKRAIYPINFRWL